MSPMLSRPPPFSALKSVVLADFEYQGTHCTGKTGKTGKMAQKIPCQGKHREFGNVAKTQGIWFAQVVNSLILKVKEISIFAAESSFFF